MVFLLAYLESTIFLGLSILHFHWAFGGSWGFDYSLPTDTDGNKVLNPTKKDSAIVGFGLLLFALFYQLKKGVIFIELPVWVFTTMGWVIGVIFLLRAIGDFKYIGFFKKVKETDFGKRDQKYYSPLCVFVSINAFTIELLS